MLSNSQTTVVCYHQPRMMFTNTFKFPNHSSLLRTMFTNTVNSPYRITGVYHAANTLYTCNLKITIYYNSCGLDLLTSSPSGISASFISLMQMKWLTFCQNNNSYILCMIPCMLMMAIRMFLYLVYFPWKTKCKCTLQKEVDLDDDMDFSVFQSVNITSHHMHVQHMGR